MAALGKKVRFVQFNGLLTEWNQSVLTGEWDNAIVLGYIYDKANDKTIKRMYAGRDTAGLEYVFDLDNAGTFSFGKTSEGWHDTDDYITNPIGQITTDMTLGDVIRMSDNGDLSRIIELMLFNSPNPKIVNFILKRTEGHGKESIDVYLKTENASTCMMSIVDENGVTVYQQTFQGNVDSSNVIGQLIPDTNFTVTVEARNATQYIQNTSMISTEESVKPVITIESITDVSSGNKFCVSDVSRVIVPNDFTGIGEYSFRLACDTPSGVLSDDMTYAQLRATQMMYRKNYYVTAKHNFRSNYHYPDTSAIERVYESSAYNLVENLNVSSGVTIISINGQSVSGQEVIDVPAESIRIGYTLANRLYSSTKATVCVDNTSVVEKDDSYINGTYYIDASVSESAEAHGVYVVIGDEYDWNAGVSNTVNVRYEGIMPVITAFTVARSAASPKTTLDVSVVAQNTTLKTLTVVDTVNNVSVMSDVSMSGDSITVSGLLPDTDYSLCAKAYYNGVMSSSTKTTITGSAVTPVISIDGIDTYLGNKNTENITNVRSSLSDLDDYQPVNVSTYDLNGGGYAESGMTLTELALKQLAYRVQYDISLNRTFQSVHYYPDMPETRKTITLHEDTSILLPLTASSSVNILSINGTPVQAGETIEVYDPSLVIAYDLTPRLYSCNMLTVLCGDASIASVEGTYTQEMSQCEVSIDPSTVSRSLRIVFSDEYDTVSGISDEVFVIYSDRPHVSLLTVVPDVSYATVTMNSDNADTQSIYVRDMDSSVTILDWTEITSSPYEVNGLVPDTSYELSGKAEKGGYSDTSVTDFRTAEAELSTVRVETVGRYAMDNRYKLSDVIINQVENDYLFDELHYSLRKTDGTFISASTLKTDFLNDCSVLMYGEDYFCQVDADVSCKYHYPSVDPVMRNVISNSYQFKYDIPSTGDASIVKINGLDVSLDDPSKVYTLTDTLVDLSCNVNSRFSNYNRMTVYVNGIAKRTVTGDASRGMADVSFNIVSSLNPQDVYVTVGDEYDTSYMTTNHLLLSYNNVGGDHLLSRLNRNASVYYSNIGRVSVEAQIRYELPPTMPNSAGVVESVLDPSFCLSGQTEPGDLLTFLDDAKKEDYYDIDNFDTSTKGGRTYYKCVFSDSTNDTDILFMLVPVGSSVELWDEYEGQPGTQRTITKAANTTVVDGKEYDVYYDDKSTQSYDNSWVKYDGQTFWIYLG